LHDLERVIKLHVVIRVKEREFPGVGIAGGACALDTLHEVVLLSRFFRVSELGVQIAKRNRGVRQRHALPCTLVEPDGVVRIAGGATMTPVSKLTVRARAPSLAT
jgi:hypothetical protein